MKQLDKSMKIRALSLLGIFFAAGFIPIIAQLFNVTILQHDFYQKKAVEQQTRDTIINPKRGTIYDRNLKPLAESATVETVFLSPVTIKAENRDLIAKNLSAILGLDYQKVLGQTSKNNQYEIIKKKVEKPQADKVREFINNNKITGVYLAEDTKRYYPYGNFAAHILGFTGDENQGLDGIEALYDNVLKGTRGRIITAKDAAGNDLPFQYDSYEDADSGTNVVLTIDEVIQHFTEKYLEDAVIENKVANRGCAIVMNVKTGEILALAVKPDFDPNKPFEITDPSTLAAIAALPQDQQAQAKKDALAAIWRDKAVVDTYEPGSVFKIVTSAMALEENVVKNDDHFYCSGSMRVGNYNISCANTNGHGDETFVQGVQNSCNPVFMQVAARVGPERFYKYVTAFGFREKTGVDLPGEAVGIFHQLQNLNEVELATSAFGQTFKVTPMQMITAIAAVANGGKLLKPYVVSKYMDDNNNVTKTFSPVEKRQVISERVSENLRGILESVVTEGTGSNAYTMGFRVAGKTGTSEKIDKKNQTGQTNLRIASFGAFAPANNPQIAVLVMLDEPGGYMKYGGQIAAPVVSKIIENTLKYMNVEPQYTPDELKSLDVVTPDLIGKTASECKNILTNKGIKYRIEGTGDSIVNQIPKPNTKMPVNGMVILYLNNSNPPQQITVPNVLGRPPSGANTVLINSGLNMTVTGTKANNGSVVAFSQSPVAGSVVPVGSVISVEFRDPNSTVE